MKILQDLLVNVTVESLGQNGFEFADVVTIPVGSCNLSSSTSTYSSRRGLASIKLAYDVVTTSEEFIRDCIKHSKLAAHNYW